MAAATAPPAISERAGMTSAAPLAARTRAPAANPSWTAIVRNGRSSRPSCQSAWSRGPTADALNQGAKASRSGRRQDRQEPPSPRRVEGGRVRHARKRSSARASGSPPRRSANQPTRTSSRSSNAGTYGLMSSSGVPSTMSTSSTSRVDPAIATSRTVDSPIGFGRAGERVAKIPCGRSSRNGVTVSRAALDPMQVIDQDQVAEPVEVGEALDEFGIELDPAGDADRGGRLDRHALGIRERRSDDADRPVGDRLSHRRRA